MRKQVKTLMATTQGPEMPLSTTSFGSEAAASRIDRCNTAQAAKRQSGCRQLLIFCLKTIRKSDGIQLPLSKRTPSTKALQDTQRLSQTL
jgi:hypothetical protein